MFVLVIGVSVGFVVEASKLHLDHTPRWPPGITPSTALKLHQLLGHYLIEWRGRPATIRVDNGPEYVSGTLMTWAGKRGIVIWFIQPGKPQRNAYVERYNRTVRVEWLGQCIFETIEEVQQHATQWLWTYNHERPNMAIGGITPAMKLKAMKLAA